MSENPIRSLFSALASAMLGCVCASAQTYPPPLNLTRYMAVTASSNADSLGGNPKYAVDGLVCEESRWITDPVNTAHWLEVDLAGTFQIGSANVITGTWDTAPVANFSLQYWTGAAWANIPGATLSGNTLTQRQIVFTSPVTTTKVRFYSDDNGSIAVKELAVFPPKTDGTAHPIGTEIDIRSGMLPKVTGDSYNATGQRPYLAYDGFVADGSRWISANGTSQHWLEYAFVKEREVAYAHVYTGLGTGSVIANFRLQSWNSTSSSWVDIPGGTVTGNTQSEVFLNFSSTIRTLKVRLVTDDDGNVRVKELVLLPPNGGAGYPRGTGVVFASPPSQKWSDYSDAFYNIKNRVAGMNLRTASNGAVTIEYPGSSFSQQYNILLNIGTDTYRLCNRANEHCLEVAGGSVASGATVQEGDYVGRPYQQWRLVATGSYFKLVNAYSGLLLTVNGAGSVAGASLIQQADTSSNTQQWSLPYVTYYPKKGVSSNEISGNILQRYNASHYYNWSLDPYYKNETADSTRHQPMWWGITNDRLGRNRTEMLVLSRPNWAVADGPTYLLGFNEPNHTDQSNISVQTALDEWSRAEQVKLPLVGPQHDYAWGSWYTSFFDQADAMGMRIDEGGGHIYPTASAVNYDAFSSGVTDGYNAQNSRVQWVTELNWVNWGGAATWTDDELYSVLAETLWRYENNPWVKRYQWFAFSTGWANGAPGALEVDSGSRPILPLGRLYSAWDGDLNVRTNTWYHLHNRGTHAQLQNSAGAPVNTTIDTVDSTVNWYLEPASSGKYYIVCNDGRRLSSNGTTVTLSAAGTTGTAVEWALTPVATAPAHYGWYYLDHPASGKHLDSPGTSGSLTMSTDTDNSPRWRFIKPYQPSPTGFTWSNPAGGVWGTGNNWIGGSAPVDGSTNNFSTLDITADRTVTLDSSRAVGGLIFGDISGSQNWTMDTSGGSVLTLDTGNGGVPSILVNQNTATISAIIAGTSGFTKGGAGTLALTGYNNYTGTTTVSAGTLVVSGLSSVENLAISGGSVVVSSGTYNVTPTGGGTFVNNGGVLTVNSGATLNISNTSSTYFPVGTVAGQTGTIIVNGGTISVNTNWGTEIGQLGSGVLTINSGVFSSNTTLAGNGFQIAATAGQTGVVNLNGGVLKFDQVQSAGAAGAGKFYFNGGTLTPLETNPSFFNSSNVSVQVRNGGALIDTAGFDVTITNAITHSSVSGDNAMDGGLTKSGAGILTLGGANSYTGATIVGSGTLLVNGSSTTTSTTVSTGATLGGSGTVGNVTVQSGGIIAPGGAAVGTFTAGNTTLGGTLAIDVPSVASADRLIAAGSVSLSGPLAVNAPAGLPVGTVFTIVSKTSAGAISGNFTGKPQNSLFTASGNTWIVSYTGGDGNDVTLTIASPQQQWLWNAFGANWNNPAIAGDFADPDKDGVSNLLERAFAGNPNVAESGLLPSVDPSAPLLSIQYRKSKAATDLGFQIEECNDISTGIWSQSVGASSVISENESIQIIRFTAPPGTQGRKFLRVRVATLN